MRKINPERDAWRAVALTLAERLSLMGRNPVVRNRGRVGFLWR